ncbi:MAG: hypothetical protein ACE5HV_02670 [Acidobacteriota bacterium]
MTTLRNILGVARYERTMLLRTTRFRVLGAIGVAIPVWLGIVMAVAEARGFEQGAAFGLSAFIPFYVYSYLQTVVIAFVAGNFRAADERAQVDEVIAAKPLSTAELVIGKYVGVIEGLCGLSLAVMFLTMAIQAAKLSIVGTPFSVTPYLAYLLLMTLPALIYMSAFTFFLGSALRHRTAGALLSIAYAISVLFFLGSRYGGIFDFGAFFAPLLYSDMMGLGDISRLIELRFFYLALAGFLLGLSIVRYPRLRQAGAWAHLGSGVALVGIAAAMGLYGHMARQDASRQAYRDELLAIQERHADLPAPETVHYDMEVELMRDGVPLQARTKMRLRNPNNGPLDTLLFTLNPGLLLQSVHDADGRELAWERQGSVVRISMPTPLAAGEETVVTLSYAGDVDPEGFDLLRTEARLRKSAGPLRKGELTAWIRPESVFLPPRSRWYPAAGVDYGHQDGKASSFVTARITVTTPAGMEVITQGRPLETDAQGGRVRRLWEVARPVPVFSLNAGIYEVYEANVGKLDVALYLHPAHRGQALFFEDATEEVIGLTRQLLAAMERETGLPYPYPRLSIVEVPFLIQWYYEGWEEHGGLTQPGVLMVEEDILLAQSFSRNFSRLMLRTQGNQEPARIKRDLLARAVFAVFLSPEGSHAGLFRSPLVQLWSFDRGFVGAQAALLARGMPIYLQEDVAGELRRSLFQRGRGRGGGGRFAAARRRAHPARGGGFDSPSSRGAGAAAALAGGSRRAIGSGASWDEMLEQMQQRPLAELDPEDDPEIYRSILDAKGLTLFRMAKAVVGSDEFVDTLESFGEASRYQDVSFDEFEKAIAPEGGESSEGTDVERLIHDWLYGTYVPGYTLTRATARKVDNGWGAVVYQVIVRIRNGEAGRGFVQVQVSGRRDEAVKNVQIDGGQEVEVALTIRDRPFRVAVEPFLAKNRRPLIAPLRIPEEVDAGPAESYVRLVTAEATFTEIVIDNEDDGFSMPVRRVQRYLRPGLQGDNWQVRSHPFAFGRYETNFRWKSPGDGAQPAAWAVKLPYEGDYDVAYYFLPSSLYGRIGLRGLASSFGITVAHGGQTDELTLTTAQLEAGWNLIGRFHFEADEEARVELSDRADGRLYADAVRWRYVDPDNPDAAYEEGIAPWDLFSRRKAGAFRGRGGQAGFDRDARRQR